MSEIAKILLVTLNRQFHVTRRTVPWLSLKLREGAGTVPSNWLGAVSTDGGGMALLRLRRSNGRSPTGKHRSTSDI